MWFQTPTGKVKALLESPCEEYRLAVPVVTVPWFEQERQNDQEGTLLEGIKAGWNATTKVEMSSQVAHKPDDSPMTYQLSRPRLGSKHANQSHGFPQNRTPTDKDGHGDCKVGPKFWDMKHMVNEKTLTIE